MDMVVWLVIASLIGLVKVMAPGPTIEVYSDDGESVVETIASDSLDIGNNFAMQREPRAYHMILIDLGLIQ